MRLRLSLGRPLAPPNPMLGRRTEMMLAERAVERLTQADDVLLPEQLPRSEDESPARRLWGEVLRLAVEDAVRTPWCDGRPSSPLGLDAMTWLWGTSTATGSFLWCCEVLNIDPRRVRRGVLRRLWRHHGSCVVR